jgi:ubiquinone/menaquinone biosynthesis C-methylase UbiE
MTSEQAGPLRTVAAYDALAGDWDRGLGFRSPQFAARLRAEIVRLLEPAAGGRLALKLGAGTGWMLDAVSPLFDELQAIEPSEGMLQACRRRIATSGLRNVSAHAGDAMSLDGIAAGSVDAIYAVGLIDAVADPARVLAACRRVLKPGGLLVLATANGDCPWHRLRDRLFGTNAVRTGRYFTSSELARLAGDAGLQPVEIFAWGAAPQRVASPLVIAAFDLFERAVRAAGLSRYLSILTASFRSPRDLRAQRSPDVSSAKTDGGG